MKKLFILLAAVALTAMSANVFAQQSTGTAPSPGATHNYFVTDNSAIGNTVLWTVTKGNLSEPAGSDVVIDAATSYATDITWDPGLTVGDWYYVHVVESDGTCTNEKVLPVQITASPFYLTLAAANAEQCYDGAVSVSIDENDQSLINYDHGNATIVFTVSPTGLSDSYDGYTFDMNLVVPAGYDYATPTFSTNVTDFTGGTVTTDDNAAVTITYVVDNTNTFTNSSDPDAQDFTATASISNGEANNGVDDNGTDGTYTDATDVSRPNTSGIGTN